MIKWLPIDETKHHQVLKFKNIYDSIGQRQTIVNIKKLQNQVIQQNIKNPLK